MPPRLLGPIDVSQTETIEAYASAPGYPNSATAMAVYIVTPGGADAGLDAGLGPDDAGPVDALP
jgi:hypothetical protein